MPIKDKTGSKVLVQVRIADDVVKQIDHLGIDWAVYRGEAIERLLREALAGHKRVRPDGTPIPA